MIQSQSFVTALPYASKLSSLGKIAVAKPNTVIQNLVQLSNPSYGFPVDTEGQLATYGNILENITSGSIDEPTHHGLELNAYNDDLSKLVSAHISHAKNVVKPLVIQFAEAIKHYSDSTAIKEASENFNIITLDVPAVLADESFLDNLSYYKDKAILQPDLRFSLEEKTKEDILQLLLVGHDRTDKLIVEWVSKQNDDFLNSVWVNFFSIANTTKANSLEFNSIERLNVFEKANYALAIYLLARKLYDDVQNAKDMNLTVYKKTAVQIRDYAGSLLADSVKRIALYIKTKVIVIETNSNKYTVKVNGQVYREWLQSGGSPEVILGLVVSDAKMTTQSSIDEKTEEFKRQWNSYNTFFKTSEQNKKFVYFKEFLANEFNQLLKNKHETEISYIEKNPNYVSNVRKLVDEEIYNLKTKDISDVYSLALVLIAKHRFYYTSSFNILNDINEAAKSNPDVDVREAALLASINYLADYVSDQITLSS